MALTIGLIELTAAARSMQEFSFQVFEAFTGATIIYIVINVVVVSGMHVSSVASPCRALSAEPAGGRTLRAAMFSNIDWDVIVRSLPYLFFDGMRFTIILTLLATTGGIVIGTLLALMRLSAFRRSRCRPAPT